MNRLLTLATLAIVPLLLSGCSASNGDGGQSAEGAGHLAYNGANTGAHQSKVDCGGSGTLHWSGNLGSGKVTVTVLDASGASKFSKTYSTVGQSAESKPVSGAAGEWTVKAERAATSGPYGGGVGSWSGQYAIHLDC